MSMNWSDLIRVAEDGGAYDALPEGRYTAKVIETQAKPASTGKPMITATFEVVGGPYNGRRFWNNFVITRDNPNAMSWFFRHMQVFGLDKNFFEMNPSLEATAAQLVGKTCVVTLGVRQYQGDNKNTVKKIEPVDGAGPATVNSAPPAVPF